VRWKWWAALSLFLLAACDSVPSGDDAVAGTQLLSEPFHVASSEGGIFPVAVISDPEVSQPGYLVAGKVTVEDVNDAGYLEMWSVFADGSRFFSRTLAAEGTMRTLTGSGSWEFELPFYLEGTTSLPSSLEINVVLPGFGQVWVEDLDLRPLGKAAAMGRAWSWAGAALGTVGALIGGLSGRLKARRFVLGTLTAMAALGLVLLVIGTVVWLRTRSVGEAYGFLLMGVIAAAVGAGSLPSIRRRYADNEMRRMQAMDVA